MIIGQIDEGKLKGRKVILEPRNNFKDNEYLVEKGMFINGSENYSKACLTKGCEKFIPDNGCDKCN